MKLPFTKMQGAGNDFVVLDATRQPLALTAAQLRAIADRRFGVGADQILIVGPSSGPDIDFSYRIVNADGGEVEQCGNGARCFVRYVREQGLTDKTRIRVATAGGVIEPEALEGGLVRVDMGAPVFEPARLPFDTQGLAPRLLNHFELWSLPVNGRSVEIAVVSMGNPHAVQRVDDVDSAPVAEIGPLVEGHARFPRRVNAGFMQVLGRQHIRLRVYERGAGETLACGTGACAAVVAGIRLGWLDASVRVDTRGGRLDIAWAGPGRPVMMSGPAVTVFEGELDLAALPEAA
jgi:diaminopimelate epimerase